MDARSSYREAAVRGATPAQLVIFLYEQTIEDLRRAVVALEKGDIEARTRGINHALTVIAQLQGSLDMERGGDVAKNLQQFYNGMRASLCEAQIRQSARILEQQIEQLVLVREAWLEVDLAAAMPNSLPAESASAPRQPAISSQEGSPTDWSA